MKARTGAQLRWRRAAALLVVALLAVPAAAAGCSAGDARPASGSAERERLTAGL
jgi:hypothetical protein